MSFRLRAKYQMRRFKEFCLLFLRLPVFLQAYAARVTLLVLVVLAAGLYVWQVSALTSGGYEIKRMEEKIVALKTENQKLETDLAAAESLAFLETRLLGFNMVPATKVIRIKAARGSAVAER